MMLSSVIDYAGAPLYAKLCQNLDLVIFAQCSSRTERMVLIVSQSAVLVLSPVRAS